MITKLVKRFYCEFCRKGGMTKAIQAHENSCIKNPARTCVVCHEYTIEQVPMDQLIATAGEGLHELWQITDCPACILAALAQRRNLHPDEEWQEFDYKEAMRELRAKEFAEQSGI